MSTIALIWQFLEEHTGIVCCSFRRKHLTHIIHQRMQIHKCHNEKTYLNLIKSPQGITELHLLIEEVTVGETSFLRHPDFWKNLQSQILPELVKRAIRENRKLKLWSAGCSTGEETYTLALFMFENYPVLPKGISILGSDINESSLKTARNGCYKKSSFRENEARRLLKHFTPHNNHYCIDKRIQKMVRFENINLMGDITSHALLQDCDLIICRNVLIYYDEERIKDISHKLFSLLNDGGYLSLGGVAASLLAHELPKPVRKNGFSWYRNSLQSDPQTQSRPKEIDQILQNKIEQSPTFLKPEEKKGDLSSTPKELYSKAIEHYIREEYPAALNILESKAIGSATYEMLILQGLISLNIHSTEKAREILGLLEKCSTNQTPEHLMLESLIYEAEELWEDAIEKSRAAAFTDCNFFSPYYHLGILYQRIGQREESTRYYRIALDTLQRDSVERIKLFCGNVSTELITDICQRKGGLKHEYR